MMPSPECTSTCRQNIHKYILEKVSRVGCKNWVPVAVAHLSADGTAALARACVDVKVEEDTGVCHFKVRVSIHSSF